MAEKNVNADSGATVEKTVAPSKELGDIYQPSTGENAENNQQAPTGEQDKGQETQEKVSGESKKQEVLTAAQVSEIVTEGITKGLRQFQSMSDKSEARVNKLISDSETRTKKIIGRDLTPQEKIALEGDVREEVRSSTEGNVDDADSKGSDTFAPSNEAKQEFASKIQTLEIKYGVRLFQGDEEAKTVDWNQRDHLKLLQQIESAIKAKSGRSQSDNSDGARGRLPAGQVGSSPDTMKNMTPGDLLRKAYPIPGQDK